MHQKDLPSSILSNKTVAWITPILGRYGKLMYMEPLLSELAKKCKTFTVITAVYPADTNNSPFNITVCSRMLGIYWKGKSSYLKGFSIISPSFYNKIKESNPDVLFLIEFSFTTIYGLIYNALHKNTKNVLFVESKPIENDGPFLGAIKKIIRKSIVKRCDAILTNNQLGKDYVTKVLHADPDKIITRPYLISQTDKSISTNSERFHKIDHNTIIKFLFVGQVIERKGLQHLVEAIKLIPEKDRNRIHVSIVGEGSYLESLSKLIRSNELDSNFQLHGQVEYSRLSEFYASAHVFVFPTLSDYRALSPFEALNASLPIISSIYDGGSPENAIDGQNGYLCDPLDTVAFSKTIIDILEHPDKLYQFSLKSIEISKEYTLDNAINSMLHAVDLAISKR